MNGKQAVTFCILGLGGRASVYLNALEKNFSGKFEITAIAEPDSAKRQFYKEKYNISGQNVFTYDYELYGKERLADVAVIATQDKLHYKAALALIEKGYDIILEKPIAASLNETAEIYRAALKRPGQLIAICHVLRHTAFFKTIKEILDTKELGEVIDIQHNENIGYYHFAHSYVRGPWRNSLQSSPLIVAKSCHDMDILLYLLNGKKALKICSLGSLNVFTQKNYNPSIMSEYCTECKSEKDCPYSAMKIYSGSKIKSVVFDLSSTEKIKENLGGSPYGKCVYRCDNNVADHQVAIIEFEDGITATFNLSAFTSKVNRSLKIMCEFGEIRAIEKPYTIEVHNFKDDSVREINLNINQRGHGGGDENFISDFMETYLNKEEFNFAFSESVESHVMAYLAEESRISGGAPQDIQKKMNEIRQD